MSTASHVLVLEGVDYLPLGVVVRDRVEDPRLLQHLRRRTVADDAGVALALAVRPGSLHGARLGTVEEASAPKLLAERLFPRVG